MKHIKTLFSFSFFMLLLISCVEKYEPKTTTFQDVLVVESTITDEYKRQEVKLSRTIPLDSIIPDSERNAIVKVTASNSNTYNFEEVEGGVYKSIDAFKAEPNLSYKLTINTEDNQIYESTDEELTVTDSIENLYAEQVTKNGALGIEIYIDTPENNAAKYFRYEYEDTYKIITPYTIDTGYELWNLILHPLRFDFHFYPQDPDHICYKTQKQNKIIIYNTKLSEAPKLIKKPVRFININDEGYLIKERYSILVKQYIINENEYKFYKILKDFNSNKNILSPLQTGFVHGNIHPKNSNNKVFGVFSVASSSTKRIYMNQSDFDLPTLIPYPYECKIESPLDYRDSIPSQFDGDINERLRIYQKLKLENYSIYSYQLIWNVFPVQENTYIVYLSNPECSTCSVFASSIRPDWWQD